MVALLLSTSIGLIGIIVGRDADDRKVRACQASLSKDAISCLHARTS